MKAKNELKNVDMIINVFGIWDEIQWEKEMSVNIVSIKLLFDYYCTLVWFLSVFVAII